jgi:hypothetical protein
MPQRISPSKIVMVTKDGECQLNIVLELNINLNANGQIGVAMTAQDPSQIAQKAEEKQDDSFPFEIPDFTSGAGFDFGQDTLGDS